MGYWVGNCLGAATVTRAGSLVYGAAIMLWLSIVMPDWKRCLASIVAVTIPFALVLAPWSIRNTRVHGKFVPLSTQEGIQLYISNNSEATGMMATDQAYVDATRAQRFPNIPVKLNVTNFFTRKRSGSFAKIHGVLSSFVLFASGNCGSYIPLEFRF